MITMAYIRILIVDDSDQWRAQIRGILEERPDWKVASEACDGHQAVQQAAELRPDIILLDIGMPVLNGIAAAKQIRLASPVSKIVFLTQNVDPEIIQEALAAGGSGYVLKANAGKRLLQVVDALARSHATQV
jgi:DNA-binding NarL/FixJ family response regulator